MEYPNGWTPPENAQVTEKRVDGGTVRVYIPRRTPEQTAAFLEGVDRAVWKAFPGRRLKMPESEARA